jgi:hypothetical protein
MSEPLARTPSYRAHASLTVISPTYDAYRSRGDVRVCRASTSLPANEPRLRIDHPALAPPPLHHRLAIPLPVPLHPLSKLRFKLELTRRGHLQACLQQFEFVPLPQTLGVTPTPGTPALPLPLRRGSPYPCRG